MLAALAFALLIPSAPPVVLDAETKAKLQAIAFQAAREGDTKTLKEYFSVGEPVNATNSRGDTLLGVAAYNGQADAVILILEQSKVDVEVRNRMGLTVLSAAAFKGHVDIAKHLVKAKADPNAANDSGQTPLMFAALTGRTEMVKYLLEAGAKPTAKDKVGNTPASLARGQGAKELAELLEAAARK